MVSPKTSFNILVGMDNHVREADKVYKIIFDHYESRTRMTE